MEETQATRRVIFAQWFCDDPRAIIRELNRWILQFEEWESSGREVSWPEWNLQWLLQDILEGLRIAAARSEVARQIITDSQADQHMSFLAAINACQGFVEGQRDPEKAAEFLHFFHLKLSLYTEGFLTDFIAFRSNRNETMNDEEAQALNAEIQDRLKYIRNIAEVRSKTDVQSLRLAVEYSLNKSHKPDEYFDGLPTYLWNSIAELGRETREKLAEVCAANNRELSAIQSLMSPDRSVRDDAWLLFRVAINGSRKPGDSIPWHPEMIPVSKLGELISRREFGSRYPQEKLSKSTVERRLAPEWKNNRIRRPAGKTKGPVQVRSDFWDELTAKK